jgi:ATP-dependent Lon protease
VCSSDLLSGFIDAEKVEIAKHFLVPKSLKKNGLARGQVAYTKDALYFIAEGYAREAGVRAYELCLDKIHRKIVRELIEDEENTAANKAAAKDKRKGAARNAPAGRRKNPADKTPPPVTKAMLPLDMTREMVAKYLGKPIFPEEQIKVADKPGMTVGLAWTSLGGDTLVIEATSVQGKGQMILTGQMGDVMKESATIAHTVARKIAIERYNIKPSWFEKNQIHLHIPEGATPKDGPSAGITMATAFCSLFKKQVIKPHFAMTGELSLTGKVLPIGGLKEKTIAARHNKCTHIIIPKENLRDLDDIPEHVKKGITFHPVERFDEVLALVLP